MKTRVKITFLMLWAMFMPLMMKAGVEVPPNGTDANLYGHVIDKQNGEHLPYIAILVRVLPLVPLPMCLDTIS